MRPAAGFWFIASLLVLDQVTKWLVLRHDTPWSWPVEITSFFNLVLVWNRGVSFGLLQGNDADAQRWILTGVAFAVAGVLVHWLRRGVHEPLQRWSFRLIVGGAVGNAIDRIIHGAVVDFLDFHYAGWHWPAFNVADAAIVTGALLLVADGLRLGPPRPHPKREEAP